MAIAPLQLPGYQAQPGIDWSPLSNLGKVYEQAQAKRGLQEALAGGVNTADPQSLSQLAARVLPYDATTGLTLAQLGNTAANRQQDMAWRQQESERAQQNADRSFGFQQTESSRAQTNADRSYGIQERGADRLEATAEEASPTGRAKIASQYGLTPGTPEHKAFVLTGKLPEANTTVEAQTTQRQQAASKLGLTPDNPAYQSYILTGKMPKEDAQPLTATDKKAILEADEGVLNNQQTIDNIKTMKTLSKKAYEGPTAAIRGETTGYFGSEAGQATVNLQNLSTANALSQLKATFGGAPTEGERKILLDIQGSANQPDSIRQEIYARAERAAQNRLRFNQQRADELRGGQFYKSGTKTAPKSGQGAGADTMLGQARDAIAAGAPRDAVIQRLQAAGIEPGSL